jgi:hypothetical protein
MLGFFGRKTIADQSLRLGDARSVTSITNKLPLSVLIKKLPVSFTRLRASIATLYEKTKTPVPLKNTPVPLKTKTPVRFFGAPFSA